MKTTESLLRTELKALWDAIRIIDNSIFEYRYLAFIGMGEYKLRHVRYYLDDRVLDVAHTITTLPDTQ